MATLAHLLAQNWEWRDSRIRVLRVIEDAAGRKSSREAVKSLIDSARIRAEPHVIVSSDPFRDVLQSHSAKSDAVFLGIQPSEDEPPVELYRRLDLLVEHMPTTVLVYSSGEADVFA